MKPNLNLAVGGLIGLAVVMVIALTYLISIDKADAPQAAAFGTALTGIVGGLLVLISVTRSTNPPPPPDGEGK